MQRVLFIINPISGVGAKRGIVNAIERGVDRGRYNHSIVLTQYAGHAKELSADAVKSGYDVVVAVGGDGTVNEVASALVGTETALAIIPCGSGNGFANHLGFPASARKVVEIINAHKVITVDTATINGIPFFCTAGVGFDARVAFEYSKAGTRGLLTYAKEALKEWSSYDPDEYVITTDDGEIKTKALIITCGNANQWGCNFHITPKASISDGKLEITVVKPIHFYSAPKMFFQLKGHSICDNDNVLSFRSGSVRISRLKNDVAHYDGEVYDVKGDIWIKTVPASLKVVI